MLWSKKYQDGGPIYGPSHDEGGVQIPVSGGQDPVIEAEGGEFVVSKKAMEKYGPQIKAMNADGNKEFTSSSKYQFTKEPTRRERFVNFLSAGAADPQKAHTFIDDLTPRLPSFAELKEIVKNPDDLFQFTLMMGLTGGRGRGKGKGNRGGRLGPGAERRTFSTSHELKKLGFYQSEGKTPILRGGKQEVEIHGRTGFMKDPVFNEPGAVMTVTNKNSPYFGWSYADLGDGYIYVISKKSRKTGGRPSMLKGSDAEKFMNEMPSAMQAKSRTVIDPITQKEHTVHMNPKDIEYSVRDPQSGDFLKVDKKTFDAFNKRKYTELPNTIGNMKNLGKEPNTSKFAQNLWRLDVVGEGGKKSHVYIQNRQLSNPLSSGSRNGWFKVSQDQMDAPHRIRPNSRTDETFLGYKKSDAYHSLRSGLTPAERRLEQIERHRKASGPTPAAEGGPGGTPLSTDLPKRKKYETAASFQSRLNKHRQKIEIEKKKAIAERSQYRTIFHSKKGRGAIPDDMTFEEWFKDIKK